MFNNFINLLRFWAGLKLLCLLLCMALIVIIFYQLLITLFVPCFINVVVLLFEFIGLICLGFFTIFGC